MGSHRGYWAKIFKRLQLHVDEDRVIIDAERGKLKHFSLVAAARESRDTGCDAR